MPVNQQNPQVPDECSVNETMSPFIQRAFVMTYCVGFPRSSVGKEFACNAGDPGSTPGLGRSSGEGNGNPLQNSCLENLLDRGAWQATVHGIARVGHNLATKPPPLCASSWGF